MMIMRMTVVLVMRWLPLNFNVCSWRDHGCLAPQELLLDRKVQCHPQQQQILLHDALTAQGLAGSPRATNPTFLMCLRLQELALCRSTDDSPRASCQRWGR